MGPVELLRSVVDAYTFADRRTDVKAALVELERRATIEAARDAFLFANVAWRETHECGHERHWVVFHLYGLPPGPRVGAADYWTACDGALKEALARIEHEERERAK